MIALKAPFVLRGGRQYIVIIGRVYAVYQVIDDIIDIGCEVLTAISKPWVYLPQASFAYNESVYIRLSSWLLQAKCLGVVPIPDMTELRALYWRAYTGINGSSE
jgi:hypothetical protein